MRERSHQDQGQIVQLFNHTLCSHSLSIIHILYLPLSVIHTHTTIFLLYLGDIEIVQVHYHRIGVDVRCIKKTDTHTHTVMCLTSIQHTRTVIVNTPQTSINTTPPTPMMMGTDVIKKTALGVPLIIVGRGTPDYLYDRPLVFAYKARGGGWYQRRYVAGCTSIAKSIWCAEEEKRNGFGRFQGQSPLQIAMPIHKFRKAFD